MQERTTDTTARVAWLWALPAIWLPLLPEYIAPILAIVSFVVVCVTTHKHRESLQIGQIGKILLIYMAYMLIGTLYSAHPLNTLSTFAMWLVMFAFYLSLTTLLQTRERFDMLFAGLAIAAGVAGLIAVVQYVGIAFFKWEISEYFWDPIDMIFYKYFPMELDFFVPGKLRTGGPFNNQNIFAEYLVMALPFSVYYAFSGRRTTMKLVARIAVVFAVAGVGVSLCRGAYLALLVMIVVWMIFVARSRIPLITFGVAGVSCLPQSILDRFVSIGSGDKSIMNRLRQWQIALEHIAARPLFGYGAGVSNTTDMLHAAKMDAPHMHNLILMLWIEGGLPSLILVGMVIFTVLRYSMDLLIRRINRPLAVALMAFVAGFMTCSMFDFPLMTPKLVGFFLIVMAIADAGARVELGRTTSWLSRLDSSRRSRLNNP